MDEALCDVKNENGKSKVRINTYRVVADDKEKTTLRSIEKRRGKAMQLTAYIHNCRQRFHSNSN